MVTTNNRRRVYTARLGIWTGRVATLAALSVLVTMLSGIFQESSTSGGRSGTTGRSHASVSITLRQPGAIGDGNCPDAKTVAVQAALWATTVGPSVARLQLFPAMGCDAAGKWLRAYRQRVRVATLSLTLAQSDWIAATADIRQEMTPTLARSLRALYPRARVRVVVLSGDRIVGRALH